MKNYDDLINHLKQGDFNEFELFGVVLGGLMVRGLTQLSPDDQKTVTAAMNDGGEILAVCRPEPLTVSGMLTHHGRTVEIFRCTEATTLN